MIRIKAIAPNTRAAKPNYDEDHRARPLDSKIDAGGRMNLARTLLQALKDHGASEIFGIPGDFALPFFKEIEESGLLPLYTLSHEPGVGFAADGAARASGHIGVAAVTYGAGALNLVNPIASAFA
jgi:indolepyruvate decarboxylase